MKCNYCGYNLEIEDKFCPYCGKPNEHVKQHTADMEKYAKDYDSTKREVIANSRRFNNKTARIAIICALVALCAINVMLTLNMGDIYNARQEKRALKNKAVHMAQIAEYESDCDYMNLQLYMMKYNLGYREPFSEYNKVYEASSGFRTIFEKSGSLYMNRGTDYAYASRDCEAIARSIHSIKECSQKQKYDKEECYKPEHQKFLDSIVADTADIVQTYFGLTDEQIESMWTMSNSKLAVMLEDAYLAREEELLNE